MSSWKDGGFRISTDGAIETVQGWTYNGIGIFRSGGLWSAEWIFIHLNSGHAVARLRGASATVDRIKEIGAEIADAGDWSFDGLDGFKNMFPDAPERISEIMLKHVPSVQRKPTEILPDPVKAKAISLLREDEELQAAGKDLER